MIEPNYSCSNEGLSCLRTQCIICSLVCFNLIHRSEGVPCRDVQLIDVEPGEFKKAYPGAKLIAPQEATERSSDKSLVYDGGQCNLCAFLFCF